MVYFYYVYSRRDKIKGHMENPSLVSRFTWIPILYSILTVLNSDIRLPPPISKSRAVLQISSSRGMRNKLQINILGYQKKSTWPEIIDQNGIYLPTLPATRPCDLEEK
jgi:hypothetical protein